MFLFLLLPLLLVLGAIVVFGLPFLPLIAVGAIGLAVYRGVRRHHAHQSLRMR